MIKIKNVKLWSVGVAFIAIFILAFLVIGQNLQRPKEIDESWIKISPFVGGPGVNKVWDTTSSPFGWKPFTTVYPSVTQPRGVSTGQPAVKGSGIIPTGKGDEYNALINEAADVFGVEPELIKAVMFYESKFKPGAISPTGCRGLMQVCGWSKKEDIRKKYGLTEDWKDPKSNIYVGTYILKGKLNYVKSCQAGDEHLKCAIAAYNAGEGTINSAAKAVGAPALWKDVNKKLQEDDFVKKWYPDTKTWTGKGGKKQKWTDIVNCGKAGKIRRRVCKFKGINSYVTKIFNLYKSYKQYGIVSSTPVASGPTVPGGTFSFVVMSDTNGKANSIDQPAAVTTAVNRIVNDKPAFVILPGDMIAGVKSSENRVKIKAMWASFYSTVVVPLKASGILFFPGAGNHDAAFNEILPDEYAKFWTQYSQQEVAINGSFNSYYSFDYNGWHFIMLYASKASISQQQLNWLEKDLAQNANKNTFVFGHIQLKQLCQASYCAGDLTSKVKSILEKNPQVRAYFHGHQQVYYKGVHQGINVVSTGRLGAGAFKLINSGSQKATYVEVDVSGSNFAVRAKEGPSFTSYFDESKIKGLNIAGYSDSSIPQQLS